MNRPSSIHEDIDKNNNERITTTTITELEWDDSGYQTTYTSDYAAFKLDKDGTLLWEEQVISRTDVLFFSSSRIQRMVSALRLYRPSYVALLCV